MRKSKFTGGQVAFILRQADEGTSMTINRVAFRKRDGLRLF